MMRALRRKLAEVDAEFGVGTAAGEIVCGLQVLAWLCWAAIAAAALVLSVAP